MNSLEEKIDKTSLGKSCFAGLIKLGRHLSPIPWIIVCRLPFTLSLKNDLLTRGGMVLSQLCLLLSETRTEKKKNTRGRKRLKKKKAEQKFWMKVKVGMRGWAPCCIGDQMCAAGWETVDSVNINTSTVAAAAAAAAAVVVDGRGKPKPRKMSSHSKPKEKKKWGR